MPLGPCLDCEDRHEKCHSRCYKYMEYKNKVEEIKRAKKEAILSYSTHFISKRGLRRYGT